MNDFMQTKHFYFETLWPGKVNDGAAAPSSRPSGHACQRVWSGQRGSSEISVSLNSLISSGWALPRLVMR
jgi:hypothetical protein